MADDKDDAADGAPPRSGHEAPAPPSEPAPASEADHANREATETDASLATSEEFLVDDGLVPDEPGAAPAASAPPGAAPVSPVSPVPEAAAGADPRTEERFASLGTALETMSQRLEIFATQIKRKNDIIATLNEEAQKGRDGIALELLRPMFSALVRMLAELDADVARRQQEDPQTAAQFAAYRTIVRNVLQDGGLMEELPTDLREAPDFDSETQEIVRAVDTTDRDLHQKLVRVVLPRFVYGDRVLFREKVEVYRYVAPIQSQEDGP